MTLCIDIHGHETMVVKLNEQRLPIQNLANGGGPHGGSRTTWRECRGVIEEVPAGAILSIYNPTGIRRFVVTDADATLSIPASQLKPAQAKAYMTGGISELESEQN